MSWIPATIEEFNKLSPAHQGALWPRCKSCRHIAQAHDNHVSEPLKGGCCESGPGQCPCCHNWVDKIACQCKGYDGPKNVVELIQYLNRGQNGK